MSNFGSPQVLSPSNRIVFIGGPSIAGGPLDSASAEPWYLSGGISAANCIAAYQPKGAASLAASYTNLANPGTYTAAPGVAPTWDANNGWIFNGSTQYLDSGIVGGNAYTAIVRFSNATQGDCALLGEVKNASQTRLNIYPGLSGVSYYRSGGSFNISSFYSSGVLAVTPSKAYANGSSIGSLSGAFSGNTTNVIALAANRVDGIVTSFFNGRIQSVSIYNITLSDAQVLAVTTAINAL